MAECFSKPDEGRSAARRACRCIGVGSRDEGSVLPKETICTTRTPRDHLLRFSHQDAPPTDGKARHHRRSAPRASRALIAACGSSRRGAAIEGSVAAQRRSTAVPLPLAGGPGNLVKNPRSAPHAAPAEPATLLTELLVAERRRRGTGVG